MITIKQIEEILSLYKKHGWNLRRVLLSAELKNSIDEKDLNNIIDESVLVDSDINSAWFSRPSKNNNTAWELRHLSNKPFALIEFFEENADETFIVETQQKMENRLREYASNGSGKKKS